MGCREGGMGGTSFFFLLSYLPYERVLETVAQGTLAMRPRGGATAQSRAEQRPTMTTDGFGRRAKNVTTETSDPAPRTTKPREVTGALRLNFGPLQDVDPCRHRSSVSWTT